ncbi:hypothetical protein BDZ94DRAFT_1169804 [Collybia nuda]|uniref:F-box domain-containing protein n=1 Tax=Collybia nuda TaxID=64659 RepID=A0A9P6CCA6_9AGAR|nr:hypothetical protein BDZ94DRAFT_1169804 [Collybia nuda]
MTQFLDLPPEILPVIFDNILKPHHITSICLVSKTFYEFSIRRLYERASIYSWQRDGKTKVIQLFNTLSRHPHLAKYVHRLEIREFPKAFTTSGHDIIDVVLEGIHNCLNLQACTWTRDGSLSSSILGALQKCNSLRDLEINGHSDGNYDPDLLCQFTRLARISLIMPNSAVADRLCRWIETTNNLQSLTLLCKASPIITDKILESLAPSLVNLRDLFLTGCPKVTHRGVWAILSTNSAGIVNLGLEGLSTNFDMGFLADNCNKSSALALLRSITLTVHQQLSLETWMSDVLKLLSSAPLEKFQIYSSGAFFESPSTDHFWFQLVRSHGQRLVRFSVHRMLISLDAINAICVGCIVLEQLFVVVEPSSLQGLGVCLGKAHTLRSVHINYPLEADPDVVPVLAASEALAIIKLCKPTLTQFGCNARVWQVGRTIEIDHCGALRAQSRLSPYESPDIPESFLVVRT